MQTVYKMKSSKRSTIIDKRILRLSQAISGIESLEPRRLLSTTAIYNFGTTTPVATPTSGTATNFAGGAFTVVNPFTNTGTGINTTSASTGYTGASGGENYGVAFTNTTANQTLNASSPYYDVSLTPTSGYEVEFDGVSFGARSTSTGATTFTLKSSVDNFASSIATGTISANSTYTLVSPTVAAPVTGATNAPVELRLYLSGGTGLANAGSTSANTRIDDVTISATGVVNTLPATITSLSPSSGSTGGGTSVTITGTHFVGTAGGSGVLFGTTPATSYTVNSDNSITAVAPAGSGSVNVTVNNGISASTSTATFTYTSSPIVTGITPTAGPTAGGTSVTISGSNFTNGSTVKFGTVSATSVTFNSVTSITAIDPAESAGVVDVTVSTGGGTSAANSSDQFTYAATPTVTSITSTSGTSGGVATSPDSGGALVTITGTGFTSASTVSFGGTAATVTGTPTATSITVTAPAHSVGTVDIVVTTVGGSSPTSSADQFVYGLTTVSSTETLPTGTLVTIDSNPVITQIIEAPGSYAPNGGATSKSYTGTAFLVQDSTGSTEIFGLPSGSTYTPAVGNTISVSGKVSPYQSDPEIGTITAISTTGTATAPGPIPTTVAAANVNPLPTSLTLYDISIKGVTLSGFTATTFGTATLNGTITDTSGKSIPATYTIGSNSTAFANLGNTAVPTYLVDVTGFLSEPTAGTPTFNFLTITPTTVAPVISSISPTSGPTTGANTVTINGYGFTGSTSVKFGASAATNVSVLSDNQITVTAPAGSVGTVDVTVTNGNGTSTTSAADQYSYTVFPVVTSLSPAGGPIGGGNMVTITGSNYAAGATVKFGTISATNVVVNSSTSITVTAPAAAGASTVDVTVTVNGATSATGSGDQYVYAAAPVVTGITPTSGLDSGGTTVTITGTGFINGATVLFGSTTATSVTYVSSTQLTAVSPSHTFGTVDVTVSESTGTSATTTADQFAYTQTTIAVLETQATNAKVTISSNPVITAILSRPGTVNGLTYTNYSFSVQDSTGSALIFGALPGGFVPVVGNTISVSGTYSPYQGVPEIASVTAITNTGTATVPTNTKTISQISGTTASNSVEGYYVTLNNVTLTPPAGTSTFGTANVTGTISDSTGSMTLYYNPTSYSTSNNFFYGLSFPSSPVNVTGLVQLYTSGSTTTAEFIPIIEPGVFDRYSMTSTATPTGEADGFSSVSRGSSITVTVTRSESDDAGSVVYSLASDSGIYGTDFSSPTGSTNTLTFAAGVASQTITINTAASATAGDKLFTILLSGPTGDSNHIPTVTNPSAGIVIVDPNSKDTVSENAENEVASIATAGPKTTGSGATLALNTGVVTVEANNTANGSNVSFAALTFNDSGSDPSDVLTNGDALKTIDGIELETVGSPSSFNVAGLLNVYLVSNTLTGTPYPVSGLTFNKTADSLEGVGTQLGTKYLIGKINYKPSQAAGVFTPMNLTTLDPTGVAKLAAAISGGSAFTIVITPGDSTVAASFIGSAGQDLQSPVLRVDYSTSLPTWASNSSAATWITPTHTLSVTGATTLVSDPGTDEPIIFGASASSATTITPATGNVDIHLGGLNLTGGASVLMSSVGASRTHDYHNVLVLGTLGNVVAPTFIVDASSKLDLNDNDLVVHSGAADDADGSTTSVELGVVQALAARGRNVAPGGIYDGTWDGNGLSSSAAAAADSSNGYEQNVLAVVLNSDLFLGVFSQYKVGAASEQVNANDVIVKYTYNGDIALEGAVNGDASTVFSSFYDGGATTQNDYAFGDLNGDGKVDGNDSTIFSSLYGNGSAGSGLPQL